MTSARSADWEPVRRQVRDVRGVAWTLSIFTAGVATGCAVALVVVDRDARSGWVEIALAVTVVAIAVMAQVWLNRSSGRRWVKHRPRVRTRLRRMSPRVRRPRPTGVVRIKGR